MQNEMICTMTDSFEGHYEVSNHFVNINKMVELGTGSQRRLTSKNQKAIQNPDGIEKLDE